MKPLTIIHIGQKVTFKTNFTPYDDCALVGKVNDLGTAYHYGSVVFVCPSDPARLFFVPIKRGIDGIWYAHVVYPLFAAQ